MATTGFVRGFCESKLDSSDSWLAFATAGRKQTATQSHTSARLFRTFGIDQPNANLLIPYTYTNAQIG